MYINCTMLKRIGVVHSFMLAQLQILTTVVLFYNNLANTF